MIPSVLMSKYEEIINRESTDISWNRDQTFLIEGEISEQKGEFDQKNLNKTVLVSGHESSGNDFNMHIEPVQRKDSTEQYKEIIKVQQKEIFEDLGDQEEQVFDYLKEGDKKLMFSSSNNIDEISAFEKQILQDNQVEDIPMFS